MKNSISGAMLVLLIAATSSATTISANGTLEWRGDPTPDGSSTWPSQVDMTFSDDFLAAEVQLNSSAYSGTFQMTDAIQTTATSRFFSTKDGAASVILDMNPLSDLNQETLENITNLHLLWAHPEFNDVAPVSFLHMHGPARITTIPEPGAIALAVLGLISLIGVAIRRR